MKQTSRKLKITLAIAMVLGIAANIAGTVYAQEPAVPQVQAVVSR